MKTTLRLLGTAAALAALAACSDTTGFSGDRLTADEADLVTDEMIVLALDGVDAGMEEANFSSAGPAAAPPVEWSRSFTRTAECPAGGTITFAGTMSGTIDRETHSGTIEVEKTLTLDDCARTRGDVTITVNTDPPITFTGTITVEEGVRAAMFTKTGTFLWETSDGRSGECEVDLTIVHDADGTTVTGSVCGREINREFNR